LDWFSHDSNAVRAIETLCD